MHHNVTNHTEIAGDWHQLDYLLVLSNLVFVLPALRAVSYRFYTSGFMLFCTGIISYLYHLCSGFSVCAGRPHILQFLDHLFASSTPQVIIVCFVCMLHTGMRRLGTVYILVGFLANGIFLSLRINPEEMEIIQFVFDAVYCIFILATSLCVFSRKDAHHRHDATSYIDDEGHAIYDSYGHHDAFSDLALIWKPNLTKGRKVDYVRLVVGSSLCAIAFILYIGVSGH
jgi:hypothetical protein